MDERLQPHDGWSTYGRRRLRTALDRWNAVRLPVRLELATRARDAAIIVNVVDTLPSELGTRATTQGGITRVEFTPAGDLMQAHVFIAVRARYGVQYRLAQQEAMLLHELGHALGLPHASGSRSLMSELPVGRTLTGTDIALARSVYPSGACAASPGFAVQETPRGAETLMEERRIVTRLVALATVTGERYSRELQWANVTLYTIETSQRQIPFGGRLSSGESGLPPRTARVRPDGRGVGAGGMLRRGSAGLEPGDVRAVDAAAMGHRR
jgi:hypothetical protein